MCYDFALIDSAIGDFPLLTMSNQASGPDTSRDMVAYIQSLGESLKQTLDDDKAEDITTIDLRGKSSIADMMIIASGRSSRHVAALSDRLLKYLKTRGRSGLLVEGLPGADWVLIDTGDIIVHLFRPEVRDFYRLEKLWG